MKRNMKTTAIRIMKTAALAAVLSLGLSMTVCAAPKTMPDGGVFDVQYYAENNSDVVQAVGYSETALYRHFQTYGIKEGRLPYAPGAEVDETLNLENAVWSGRVQKLIENSDLAKHASKVNPAKNTAVSTTALQDINKYKWADFSKYNSNPSENGLKGKSVYIVGIVNELIPAAYITYRDANGDHHKVYSEYAVVKDIDGFEWIVQTCAIDKKLDALSGDLLGKDCFVFGSYTGYSDVVKMPILNMESVTMSDGSVHTWNEYSPVHF